MLPLRQRCLVFIGKSVQAAGADFAAAHSRHDFPIKHQTRGFWCGHLQQSLYRTIQIAFRVSPCSAQRVLCPRDDHGHGDVAQGKSQHICGIGHGICAMQNQYPITLLRLYPLLPCQPMVWGDQ